MPFRFYIFIYFIWYWQSIRKARTSFQMIFIFFIFFIFFFALSLLVLVVITFSITLYFRRPRCTHKILCILEPLLKKLKQEGYIREKGETMHQYFLRYMKDHPNKSALKKMDKYYEAISYGSDRSAETIKEFKNMVKKSLSYQISV